MFLSPDVAIVCNVATTATHRRQQTNVRKCHVITETTRECEHYGHIVEYWQSWWKVQSTSRTCVTWTWRAIVGLVDDIWSSTDWDMSQCSDVIVLFWFIFMCFLVLVRNYILCFFNCWLIWNSNDCLLKELFLIINIWLNK